jgi:hypothetical protein
LTTAGYGLSSLTGGMISPTNAKRGLTLIGDFASKKMKEEGIDGEEVAKKALHNAKDLIKGSGRKKKNKKEEGDEHHQKSEVNFDLTDNEDEEEQEERNVFLYYRMANMLGAGSYGEVWKAV